MFEQQFGERILNDTHGLMLFETQPMPRFALVNIPRVIRGIPQHRFEAVFSFAMSQECAISDRERVSFDLFNSSFFQQSADSRFILLIVAVESLLEPQPRSDDATQHVEHLIALTQASNLLHPNEKDSMIGSLQWLRKESIGQAGRRFAHERLGMRRYMELDAAKFFSYVYDLRSRLVHGATPYPTRDEISSVVASLEVFVSDLLSLPLLEV
jgi:hypothetical protein